MPFTVLQCVNKDIIIIIIFPGLCHSIVSVIMFKYSGNF